MSDWYPWYPMLYETDTLHLDEGQDGVYRRLIDWYMSRRRPLPDNDAALASIARVSLDRWMERYAGVVRPFFKEHGGSLRHKRCDIELDRQDRISVKRSEIAKKGGEARQRKHREDNGLQPAASIEQAECNPQASFGQADGQLESATGQDRTVQDKEVDRASPLTPRANGMIGIASNWVPGEGVIMWARLQKWLKAPFEAEIEAFKAYSIGNGKSYADIDQAFKSWLIKARQFARKDEPAKPKGAEVYIP